jgi:hypothetical protein
MRISWDDLGRYLGRMPWETLLVLLATLATSIYAVRGLRAKEADRVHALTVPGVAPTPNPSTPDSSASGTRAEVVTVALTVLAAFLIWPIVSWTLDIVWGELSNGHIRVDLIPSYASVGLVLPLLGGVLGWRRGKSRHRTAALALWRCTVIGLVIVGALLDLAGVAYMVLLLYALAHSSVF